MTKKLVWRLEKRPSVSELTELIDKQIITKEEAREVLFNQEEYMERDKKSLESEIKFLREMVEKLSDGNTRTIYQTIEVVRPTYIRQPWFQPYSTWYSNGINGTTSTSTANLSNSLNTQFTSIKTF